MIRSSVLLLALAAALTVRAQPSVSPAVPSPEPAPVDRYAQYLVDSIVALHPELVERDVHAAAPGNPQSVIVAVKTRARVGKPSDAAWQLHADSTLAPERIYAQELVNQTVASHPDLLVVAMHVTPPGDSENVIIASNIGRIGKRADAEDRRVIDTGETLAKVNKYGDRFEVELVLHDASRRPIGALAIVFPYKAGDPPSRFEERAAAIRDELGARIPDVASLVQPYPASPSK